MPQVARCSVCKEEKSIEEVEFVDQTVIQKIESLKIIRQNSPGHGIKVIDNEYSDDN